MTTVRTHTAVVAAADDAATSAATDSVVSSPHFVRRLLRQPIALGCIIFLLALVVIAIAAPLVWPEVATQRAGDLAAIKQGPNAHHWLGTDSLGRDVGQRLLVGTRVTLIGILEALIVVLALGIPIGLIGGYFGGKLDRLVVWLCDLFFAVPAVVLVIVVLSVFPQSLFAAMVTLGVLAAPGLMRVVRSATLPVRQELYISAAQVSGLSRSYIIVRHVLPRIMGPIIVQTALIGAGALLVQTGLAYLGLIAAPPAPSWGGMVADGVSVLYDKPWLIWPPGLAIALTVLALGLLGDAVRDASTQKWATQVRRRPQRHSRPAPHSDTALVPGDGSLLSLRGITVSYGSDARSIRIVQDVDLDIAPGETVGIVGESGCGKTTTALAILNLLPAGGYIEEGRVFFDGRDITELADNELRSIRGHEIGFISQEPMISLDPAFRVGWQIAEAVRTHNRVSRRAARQRAIELLRLVQLPDPERLARRYPHELSGGMAQRVSIARALAGNPRLLIADEPTTALDVTIQAEILELLRALQETTNMAVLLVTHDLGVVADICDRVVVMYAGEVVERASTEDLFDHPMHPYTAALLASSPHTTAGRAHPLPTIPGAVPSPGSWPIGCHFGDRCSFAAAQCGSPIAIIAPEPDRESRCIRVAELVTS